MRIHAGTRAVRWISVLALLVCAVAAPAAREYQNADIGLLRVTIDTDWAPRAAPGYFPARFEFSNGGEARIIEIIGMGSRSYLGMRGMAGTGATFARQSIRVGPGDRVKLTLPIPIYADSESIRFEIRERGRPIYRFNYTGYQSRVAVNDASALVVVAPGSNLSTIALRTGRLTTSGVLVGSTVGGRGGPPPTVVMRGGSGRTLDFQLEPSRLPANWLGYTSLRAVAIGTAEWEQLTDGQKSALLTWTAAGGDLIFVDGNIKTLLPSAEPQPAANPDRVTARHLFGRIHAVPLASLSAGLDNLLTATYPDRELHWALPANGAPGWGVVERRGFVLRIPGIDGVPARVYLGILFVFSVLIGPVNYWLLRRKRQQVLMVLTAPLISAAFIVLLAGYAIAGEGFRVQGRAVTFTMLDQLTKQAVTRATVSLYAAGLTPASGLKFGRDVAVWAVGSDGSGVRGNMELDLTETQHFSGGVLQARSPTNLEQVTVRAARERLTFSPENGGMSVTNGLDATILALIYRDGNTTYRLGGRLSPGSKQTITATPFDRQSALPEALVIPARFVDLFQNQPPGSYLAVLDHSPFWEPGVSSLSEHSSVHVVLGWPEGQR